MSKEGSDSYFTQLQALLPAGTYLSYKCVESLIVGSTNSTALSATNSTMLQTCELWQAKALVAALVVFGVAVVFAMILGPAERTSGRSYWKLRVYKRFTTHSDRCGLAVRSIIAYCAFYAITLPSLEVSYCFSSPAVLYYPDGISANVTRFVPIGSLIAIVSAVAVLNRTQSSLTAQLMLTDGAEDEHELSVSHVRNVQESCLALREVLKQLWKYQSEVIPDNETFIEQMIGKTNELAKAIDAYRVHFHDVEAADAEIWDGSEMAMSWGFVESNLYQIVQMTTDWQHMKWSYASDSLPVFPWAKDITAGANLTGVTYLKPVNLNEVLMQTIKELAVLAKAAY
eukprot:TRINITY_DN4741_c0_g1_i1.p1 TRINITY_DN4741_c0_g1~~TRINITY_DN4741_c0_g1_i1.p1  ORF type:complete len:342 (-),score=74.86 TRINITY_DN4741_c0_g1_i1:1844-2869(-)